MPTPVSETTLIRRAIKCVPVRYHEPARFLVVGGVNTLISYALFAGFLFWIEPVLVFLVSNMGGSELFDVVTRYAVAHYYVVAQWTAWIFAVPISTFTMKHIVFRRPGAYFPQLCRAYLVYLPTQLAATGLIILFVTVLGLHPLIGQAATIAITTVVSYIGHKYFTFKQPRDAESSCKDLTEE